MQNICFTKLSASILILALAATKAVAQTPQPVTITVGLQNVVEYQEDVVPSQYATNPGVTPSSMPKNFLTVTIIGDIVSVNSQPAKGTYIGRTRVLVASPTPNPGGAIADITRTALREHVFEIQQSDGTPVGTVMSLGFSGGAAPPGAPSNERGNWAIVGGTGAYFGASGEVGGTGGAGRAASMSEDPANRRINGGTSFPFQLHVIPMSSPTLLSTPAGPAVTHSSDFSLVTASNPATPNELLTLFCTGLLPSIEAPSTPFPTSPLTTLDSPVAVTINGEAAQVLGTVGFPGSTNGYQINIRVPGDTQAGTAALQVSAAWIPGPSVNISVQPAK
jgi:hypothetical protein